MVKNNHSRAKRPKTTTPISKISSRDKIRAAAFTCFLEFGLRGTSLALIARRAGLSKPLVLYHYKKTDKILFELMQDWADSGRLVTGEVLSHQLGQPPLDIILAIQDATAEWMRRYPEMAAFSTVLIQASVELKEVRHFLFEVF